MGKNEEAIAQYKTYLTAYPEDANAYRNLGIVYKKLDNNELALLNLEKSLVFFIFTASYITSFSLVFFIISEHLKKFPFSNCFVKSFLDTTWIKP